ncbi:hypothetical protein [Sabulicella glaciei]|uniref:Methyl-accepting chemotaxis protein n=1 Tax=Sabulicella glaciei TaxID=2984948 RepID=A0ABT3NT62_9PROT|nr:hypothetical protein [Roseococcus sp. MDT2-1-1]
MRFLRNLSVASKLAVSAAVAMILLGTLVFLDVQEGRRAAEAQAGERGAVGAQQAAAAVVRDAMEATTAWRGVLVAQSPEAIALGAAGTHMEAALRAAGDGPAGSALASAKAELQTLTGAFNAGIETRVETVSRRDRGFFPAFPLFVQALEAASANLQFTLTGEAREEVRDILDTYVASVNETRLGIQRYLSTDDPQAATRVRRAVAQGRVHARRLVSASEGPLQSDMRRLADTGEAIGTEAEAMLALASRVLEIRTGTIQTARERLLAASAQANRSLAAAAEARAAEATTAMSGMIRFVWMVGPWWRRSCCCPPGSPRTPSAHRCAAWRKPCAPSRRGRLQSRWATATARMRSAASPRRWRSFALR